jgi:hypothetical protein
VEIFALSLKIKEEGAAAVKTATDKLRESLKGVGKDSVTAGEESSKGFKRMEMAAIAAGAAIGATLVAGLKLMVTESIDLQNEQAQLAAALKSTAGASGQTLSSLNAHADALRQTTAVTGDQIAAAQAMLLTFTKISDDTFPKATQAVLDMAQAMGSDAKSAAIQVGKALNDPIAGVAALGRVGVQFSDSQKAMIASLVETNQLGAAQTIVLKELETQFGGSAAAARNTLGGALINLRETFKELFEVSREGAQPAITAINGLSNALRGIGEALDYVRPLLIGFIGLWTAVKFPMIVSTIGMLINTLYALVPALIAAAKAQMTLNTAMSANLFGAVVAAVAALATGLSLYTIALDKATEAREKESATNPAYLAALEEIRKRRAALTAEQERANRVDAAAGSRQEELVKLAGLTSLTASELRELQSAERGYAAALQVSGLPLADRITALERLKSLQDAIATQVLTPQTMTSSAQMAGSTVKPTITVEPQVAFKLPAGGLFDPTVMAQAQAAIDESANQIRGTLAQGIGDSIGDGIGAGFERGFATGNIKEGFKALAGTMLSGLGSAMIRFGTASAGFAKLQAKIMAGMTTLNPAVTIAGAMKMIALGAALKGAAQGMFGGGGGGGSGGSAAVTPVTPFGIPMTGQGSTNQIIFGQTSATTAAGMTPRSATNVTIIGPDDPKAQRAIEELIRKGNSRGTLG